LPPAARDLTAPAAKARVSGKRVRFGTVMRQGCHPFCGERFPVIRLFYVHDEPCYIVRRANGMPVSFPVWMTQPEQGHQS
jgi:hypothetical protein